jgi:hypothetical protein
MKKSSAEVPKTSRKTAQNATSRKSRLSAAITRLEATKLRVTESRRNGQQSWSVKGASDAYFRIRIADAGYRVGLVYRDEFGKRREPYLCYLSRSEWGKAKRGSLADFVALIVEKLEQRMASGEGNTAKLDELLRRVQSENWQ